VNALQAEQIRDLIVAIQEKGFIENVNVSSFVTMKNGTIILKIEQYFHFFPDGNKSVETPQAPVNANSVEILLDGNTPTFETEDYKK
jgi:hypothetical protein